VAEGILPAADRSKVAAEKKEQRTLVPKSHPLKVPLLQVSSAQMEVTFVVLSGYVSRHV
jgi:hypothetical protein